MRAVVITKHGGPGVMEVEERPAPPLIEDGVRIAVRACGVNFADVMARLGLYPDAPKPPCVVGYEVAGEVTEVAGGVEGVKVGDRVLAGTRFGGYASEVVVPQRDVVSLPDRLSFEQGAAIPVNYATAWAALVGYGNVQRSERVLIHAAAGGVGIAAIQIAKRRGAEVIGAASPSKHGKLRELGVTDAVDYTKDGWEKTLGRFDVILNAIGGRSLARSYKMLRPGGRLIAYGASSVVSGERRSLRAALGTLASMPWFNITKQMSQSKAVIGLNMLTLWDDRGTLSPWMEPLSEMMDDGTIEPVVAGSFDFEHAGDAHAMLTERRNVGKVVLTP